MKFCSILTLLLLIAVWSLQSDGSYHSKSGLKSRSIVKRQPHGGSGFNFNRKRKHPPPNPPLNTKQRIGKTGVDMIDLLAAKVGRFEGKHLYMNGLMKDAVGNLILTDSFHELSTDPEGAKQYLFDLNAKMYGGDILPSKNLESWLRRMGKKKITIVDAKLEYLKKDIAQKFDNWKKANPKLLDANGDVLASFPQNQMPNLETDEKFTITELTYHGNKEAANIEDSTWIQVKAEQIHSRVIIAPDRTGKPYHFEGLKAESSDWIFRSTVVTEFSAAELKKVAKATTDLWKNLGLGKKEMKSLLNVDNVDYVRLKAVAEADWRSHVHVELDGGEGSSKSKYTCTCKRRKRAAGGGCAFCVTDIGEIEVIQEEQFVNEYQRGSAKEKKELANMAREHLDKVQGDAAGEGGSKVERLVHLEDMKEHFAAAEIVSWARDTYHSTISEHEAAGTSIEMHEIGAIEHRFGNFENENGGQRVRISPTKVSSGLHRFLSSKAVLGISEGVTGAVGNPMGKFFLAQTLIRGIVHNDQTTLAVIGTRLGYEVATETAVWAGTKFFSAASKVGKATKFLGKIAGPIGAVADIGISVWSLTQSVKRLNSATNKYDRNDAMASVVSDSISVATSTVVLVGSIAFPPAAPFLMAAGVIIDLANRLATAIYQAQNQVDKIDSEVPLLDFEKEQVFNSRFFDWFGTREEDYVDHMVKEKQANDMAVQQNIKFLENNEAFGGIIFPSRTMYYSGSCRLESKFCAFDTAFGCTEYTEEKQEGPCDWRKPCPSGAICDDEVVNAGYSTVHKKCICEGAATTTFGHPRDDQLVNFRDKKKIYWERAVPKDVEQAEFLCKPGSLNFVDYRVTQETAKDNEYYCMNAIGLRQKNNKWSKDKPLIFDLEDGNDEVYLDGFSNPNIFRMGNKGAKKYYGSRGSSNEFVFDEKCEGSLTGLFEGGNKETDRITLGKNCTKGQRLYIDFTTGMLSNDNGKLKMTFSSIEEVIGRAEEPEFMKASCTTKKVMLGGGTVKNPDTVDIADMKCGQDMNITILATKNMKVKSAIKKGDVAILVDKEWGNLHLDLDIYPKTNLRQSVVLLGTSSSKIRGYDLNRDGGNHELTLIDYPHRLYTTFQFFSGETQTSLYFTEGPEGAPYSVLSLTNEKGTFPAIYHLLPSLKTSPRERSGCRHMENLFDITGDWEVTGGNKNDNFILHDSQVKKLNGGEGDDTIKLHPDFKDELDLDLTSEKVKSIENIFGVHGVPMTVKCWCDSKLVAPQGGSKSKPDVVIVPDLSRCRKMDTQIVAPGHSRVVVEGDVVGDNRVTVIAPQLQNGEGINFELETKSRRAKNLQVAVSLTHRKWSVSTASRNKDDMVNLVLQGAGSDEVLTFKLKTGSSTASDPPTDPHSDPFADPLTGSGSHPHGRPVADPFSDPFLDPFLDTYPNPYSDPNYGRYTRSYSESDSDTPYIPSPTIQLLLQNTTQPFGTLVIDKKTITPTVFFDLTRTSRDYEGIAKGFTNMQTGFHLSANNKQSWYVVGGDLNDVFTISADEYTSSGRISLDGGKGEDMLFLVAGSGYQTQSAYVVNLAKGKVGYLNTMEQSRGVIKNIEQVRGREGSPDIIHLGCDTKAVDGGGGAGEEALSDVIYVSELGCEPDTNIVVKKYTEVKNSASKGMFRYIIEDFMTSSLDLTPTNTNKHYLKFSTHPWDVIMKTAFNDRTQELGLKLWNGYDNRDNGPIKVIRLSKSSDDSEEYNNPILYFQPPGSKINSEIRVSSDGVISSTIMVRSSTQDGQIRGLSVDVNRFLINITEPSIDMSIEGCSDGTRCGANQFWIFSLESPIRYLDGGYCSEDGGCRNYLHFTSKLNITQPEVYLNTEGGQVKGAGDVVYIYEMRNIHEFHGTPDTKAYTTCNTKSVSTVGEVVVTPDVCPMDLVISVESYTKVTFEDIEADELWGKMNVTEKSEAVQRRTIHYRFNEPVSFTSKGSLRHMVTLGHNYYMPFDLKHLDKITFDKNEEMLHFTLKGVEYNYGMLNHPGYDEQFFNSPSILTSDKFFIQVSRDGGILATYGGENGTADWNTAYVPEIEKLAKNLGVTLIIQTNHHFFHAGHSGANGERNVLENIPDRTSYLLGGGDTSTIYEIGFFQTDINIHTGFDKESYDEWEKFGNGSKQTIDMSSIVVPIRLKTGTKYVPLLNQEGDDLIVQMHDHETEHPAILIIKDGVHPWVAKRVQLLLANTMMDLVPNEATQNLTALENVLRRRRRRKRNTIDGVPWRLHPRAIKIPQGYTVFGISREELEDGHDIHMEAGDHDLIDLIHGHHVAAVRNGSDLFLTNLKSPREAKAKTVVISDYYEPMFSDVSTQLYQKPSSSTSNTVPSKLSGVTLHLNEKPHLVVHEFGSVMAIKKQNHTTEEVIHEPVPTIEWDDLLHERETQLLQTIPEVDKVFQKDSKCDMFCAASAYF